eukprot:3506959-Amphidinium_carterae.1
MASQRRCRPCGLVFMCTTLMLCMWRWEAETTFAGVRPHGLVRVLHWRVAMNAKRRLSAYNVYVAKRFGDEGFRAKCKAKQAEPLAIAGEEW